MDLNEFDVEDPVIDLALEYVEHEVGYRDFTNNWKKLKNPETDVKLWLAQSGENIDFAPQIVGYLNGLASQNKTWIKQR